MRTLLGLAAILGAAACMAQEQPLQPVEGARDLYFAGAAPKDALPPVHKTAAKANPAAVSAPSSAAGRAALGAMHLGLRYTLLLVTARGERGQPVAPDRNFRKGDCVAVELEANRSGYLYVLSKQSSGDWVPLFPTPELSDQSNRIDPGEIVRTPKHTCFEIDDPPGEETLFVVLSRDPRDIYELSESMKGPGERPQPSSGPTQIASAGRINSAVDRLSEEYATRDLPFGQVAKPAPVHKASLAPAARNETEHTVYVVNGSNKPAATLVTKVEIRHR
ncbi:MAG: DUF4384 domain-containing protein [Bryobacteraceae bacterium]